MQWSSISGAPKHTHADTSCMRRTSPSMNSQHVRMRWRNTGPNPSSPSAMPARHPVRRYSCYARPASKTSMACAAALLHGHRRTCRWSHRRKPRRSRRRRALDCKPRGTAAGNGITQKGRGPRVSEAFISQQEQAMAEQDNKPAEKKISIQKIYLKDFSFESPQTPQVFTEGKWDPKTNLNLRSTHSGGSGELHEVVLTLTVDTKHEDKTLFLIELQQAGLFQIAG